MTAIQVRNEPAVQQMTRVNTDEQLISLWLRKQKSEATRRTYTRAVQDFADWVGGGPLGSVTLEDLVGYREALHEHYASAHSRKLKLNAVKSLLSFAAFLQYLPFNVGAAVEADKAEQVIEDKVLEEEQIYKLLDSVQNPKHKLLIRLLYASAGRVSEIAALRWADVQDGYIIIRKGKGGKQRRVKISQKTLAALRTYRPTDAADAEPVFSRVYRGERAGMSERAMQKMLQRAGAAVGYHVTPHMFRHSHISHAIAKGAPVTVVRDSAGHSSIAVTNVYAHAGKNEGSADYLSI